VIHIPHMLLFKIFLYINMSPNEEVEKSKEIAFNTIRDLLLNAGIPRHKIDAMFEKFDRPVTKLANDKLTTYTQSCDYSDLVNEFADIINDNNKLITSEDYNNIFVTIDNIERVLDSYRMIHDKQYNRIRELSKTRKNENSDLNENIDNTKLLVNTNKRKAVYEKRQFDGLEIYRTILLITFYVLLVVYLIFGNFRTSRLYRNRMFMCLFVPLTILPLLVKYVIRYIYYLTYKVSHFLNNEAPKNVYVDI
jgi:hypothetical protein